MKDDILRIGSKVVSRDGPPLVIAESGVNHDEDMAVAREPVKAATVVLRMMRE